MEIKCCNPFGKLKHNSHTKINFKKTRPVTRYIVDMAAGLNITLVPSTMKICNTCRLEITKRSAEKVERSENVDMVVVGTAQTSQLSPQLSSSPSSISLASSTSFDFLDKMNFINELNKILPLIGVTPIIIDKIKKSQSYCRSVIDQISKKLASNIFEISLDSSASETENEMVNQLKVKFAEATDKGFKIKILSVLPRSWSARKIVKEFNTTMHLAVLAKRLVEENGILFNPSQRVGTNLINPEIKELVKEFYVSDDISRACAGKREYVIVDENNVKISKQRRLILMNLTEAYALFKQQNIGRKIGFSKFASLRPAECLLALDHHGTHSVCVCCYHQNVKLIFEPMKRMFGVDTYRDLFKMMLCEFPNTDCFLNICENCPGILKMEKHLSHLMEDNVLNIVSYKQWINQNGKNKI